MMERPNCLKCKHYYVTWYPQTPHGCRQYGVRSKDIPSQLVAQAAAGPCQGYEQRPRPQRQDKLDLKREDWW